MKTLKLFIIVSTAFLLGSIIATAIVWYYVVLLPTQKAMNKADEMVGVAADVASETFGDLETAVSESITPETKAAAENAMETMEEQAIGAKDSVVAIIEVATLPESQQTILKTLGIDNTEIVLTQTMVECAEATIAPERVEEIVNGAAPGILEASRLIGCYRE